MQYQDGSEGFKENLNLQLRILLNIGYVRVIIHSLFSVDNLP